MGREGDSRGTTQVSLIGSLCAD